MVRGRGRRSTARAVLITQVVRQGEGDAVWIKTRAEYVYGADKITSGGKVQFALTPGGVGALAGGWNRTFELAAGVMQCCPISICWWIEMDGLSGEDSWLRSVDKDGWLRGAVEVLVRVAAHELEIEMKEGPPDYY